MSYHATLGRLTDDLQARVLTSYASWQEGTISRDQFVQIVAGYLAMGNARAVALADLALAAALTVELGTPRPATGVTPKPDDQERLRGSVATLAAAAAAGDISERLTRLAKTEPSAAAQVAWVDGMSQSDDVEGWMRQLDANACELCESWASGDHVFPATTAMLHHPGCQCTPRPVVRREEKS